MGIAVLYDNENIFPVFGMVQNFTLYDVENQKIVSKKIIDNGKAAEKRRNRFYKLREQENHLLLSE